MRSGRRLSSKQDANLFIMPIARSVAPNSNAPASEVTGPASNAATTLRPSTDANSKRSALHSVGIGALRESEINSCSTTIFADSQPRCTLFGERSALASLVRQRSRGPRTAYQGILAVSPPSAHPSLCWSRGEAMGSAAFVLKSDNAWRLQAEIFEADPTSHSQWRRGRSLPDGDDRGSQGVHLSSPL